MWWECSECSGHVHRASRPVVCPECGTAAAVFLSAEPDEPLAGDSDGDGLRTAWFRAGIEQPDLVARA
jgi:hypothetical protein